MTRNKKIVIGILIVMIGIIGWICFRVAVISYALYQDGWRLGNIGWQDIKELGSAISKATISEIIY